MASTDVAIRLLGPVAVVHDGAARPVHGLRRKAVLAALALQPGETVTIERLVDIVWDDAAPRTVVETLRSNVSYLRRALPERAEIVARPAGYVLRLADATTDVEAIEQLVRQAEQCVDVDQRRALLRAVVDQWQGPPLEELTVLPWFNSHAQRLDRLRLHLQRLLIDARIELGEHQLVLPELEQLSRHHPLDEHLHRQLMLVLYRCGRQADALGTYQRLHQLLGDELGVDPSPAVRDLQAAILRQAPDLDMSPPTVPSPPPGRPHITPAQLPPTIATFAGRRPEIALLDSLLPRASIDGSSQGDSPRSEATPVVMVSGTAGVGKTALVTHWAHRVKKDFPDGQLYVNLRGFDPSGVVMDPAEAIHGFLDALGIPRDQIPVSAQAQAGLYRSVLADKRILVVIDNARDEQQVRPLLPGTPGCLVVVTSRNQLAGLVAADGAHALTLDRPTMAEARQILTKRLGARRVDAEPQAVEEIIARCDRLPLALAVVAARAAPALPLAHLAARLHDTGSGLDPFDEADPATSVRTVFSWSYQTLSYSAARLFRLLGPCPGPTIALPAVASVAGLPTAEVRPLLAELTRAHLLTETSPDRFGFHELLRAYAIEQAQQWDSVGQRAAARSRFLDHQLHTAHAAAVLLKPGRSRIDPGTPADGVTPQPIADRDAALAWFAAERSGLLATMARRPDGHDRHTWQLAWTLMSYLITRGDWLDNEIAQQAGLHAAQRLGDAAAQAHAHRSLGNVYINMERLAEARHHGQAALRLFEQVDNPVASTDVHLNLGAVAGHQGDLHQAIASTEHAYHSYRSLGHPAGQAYAAHNIGWCHVRLGDHRAALPYFREALGILVQIGDLEAAANTWDELGRVHFDLKDQSQGEHCYQQAITLYRTLGDRFREADIRITLGDRYRQAGNLDAAREAWQQALTAVGDLEPDTAAQIRARLSSAPTP